jgi:5-formyltetrahydrofolate cyclo-ligase
MKAEPSQKSLKSRLRKEIRSKRAGIGGAQRNRWDSAINQHLVDYMSQAEHGVVAAYMAFDGEPDLAPALAGMEMDGVKLALPFIVDTPGKSAITFRHWPLSCELRENRYGILEPAGTDEIRVTDIDLVLVPLVGWDRTGARLGMGASFYDRLFQPFAELGKPLRMGVAYLRRLKRDNAA